MNAHDDPAAQAVSQPPIRKRRIPSERNRRVYEQVVLHERPQQEVAQEMKISQQRVSQIVEHFQAWLAENLPPGAESMTGEEQLRLAASTVYLRQEHAYGEAMRKLDLSCEDKHSLKIRYSAQGEELWRETLRENQSGKSGYLGVALNATSKQWKLVQMAHGLLGRAMDIEWRLHDEPPQADRFHTDQTERRVRHYAQASSASVGPLQQVPAHTSDEVLSNPHPSPAAPAPLAPPVPAATRAGGDDCAIAAERNWPAQGAANFPQKSCETPAADEKDGVVEGASPTEAALPGGSPQLLWNSGPAAASQSPLSLALAAATNSPPATCVAGPDWKGREQVPLPKAKKSCEQPIEESLLPRESRSNDEPVLLSADDRRRARKERQKQLARWKAARAKAG